MHAEHGHIQEVILQNFVPHQRYYGQEPAEIADAAAREYWRTGVADSRPELPLPEWACPVNIEDMKRLIAETRRLMPDVGIQIPPNLADWWGELVAAGATDLGGLSANGDHISPEHPFPSPHQVRKELQSDGVRADRAAVRLPAVHRPRVGRAGRDGHDQGQVLELHPAARIRPHRPAGADPPGPRRGRDRAGAATGVALSARGADGDVRGDAPGGDRGHAPGGG